MYLKMNDICLHTLMFSPWTKWPFWDDNNLTQLTDIISPLCRLKIEFRALYFQKNRNTPKRIIVRQCHVFNLLVRELWQKDQHWMRRGRGGTVLNFSHHWRKTAFVKIVWRRQLSKKSAVYFRLVTFKSVSIHFYVNILNKKCLLTP